MSIAPWKSSSVEEVLRFGLVGISATALYAAIFWFTSSKTGPAPAVSAAVASVISIAASYTGHYYFTFHSSRSHHSSVPSFLVVSAILTAGNAFIAGVVGWLSTFQSAPLIATCLFYPPASFLLNRRFAFSTRDL
ncbi:MAG: GtrA family protein [Proteobacteria bacterium]|nr:GtrA family protein [Pseudomonadota bacterium]